MFSWKSRGIPEHVKFFFLISSDFSYLPDKRGHISWKVIDVRQGVGIGEMDIGDIVGDGIGQEVLYSTV